MPHYGMLCALRSVNGLARHGQIHSALQSDCMHDAALDMPPAWFAARRRPAQTRNDAARSPMLSLRLTRAVMACSPSAEANGSCRPVCSEVVFHRWYYLRMYAEIRRQQCRAWGGAPAAAGAGWAPETPEWLGISAAVRIGGRSVGSWSAQLSKKVKIEFKRRVPQAQRRAAVLARFQGASPGQEAKSLSDLFLCGRNAGDAGWWRPILLAALLPEWISMRIWGVMGA